MKIDPKKLAKKISKHVINDLYAMIRFGDIEVKKQDKFIENISVIWPNAIKNIITEATTGGVKFKAFFDGGAKPNPGEMTIGGYVEDSTGFRVYEYSRELGHGTNNEAEYLSLNYLLARLIEKGVQDVEIYGDSQLVIYQVLGKYKANGRMKDLRDMAYKRLSKINKWNLQHIPRNQNENADKLT